MIVLGISSNNLEASLSSNPARFQNIPEKRREISDFSNPKNPYVQSLRVTQRNRLEYEAITEIKKRISIGYEEWKKAIENPDSKEAYDLAIKSRIISIIGVQLINDLPKEEKSKYQDFWKSFRINTEDIIPDNCNEKTTDLILNYSVPAILDMQIDISRTYKIPFNFNNLSEGEKFLVYTHIKHDLRYQADGNKRKTYFERLIQDKFK